MATPPKRAGRKTQNILPALPPTPRAAALPRVEDAADRASRPIVLSHALLVELAPPRVRRADLLIDRGRIRGLDEPSPPGALELDCTGCIVLPGQLDAFVRLHGPVLRHLPRPIFPNLHQRLRAGLWRYEAALSPALVAKAAQLFALEALRAGVTSVLHRHSVELAGETLEPLAAALETTGLRAHIGVEISGRLGPEATQRAIRETEQFLLQRSKTPSRVRGLCAAESVGTLDGAMADRLADLSARYQTPILLDFASSSFDRVKDGQRADDWLRWRGLLGERTLLTGGALLEADELARVTATGAGCVALLGETRRLGLPDPRRVVGSERWLLGTGSEAPTIYTAVSDACELALQDGRELSPLDLFAHHQSLLTQLLAAPLGRLDIGAPADLIVARYVAGTPLGEESLTRHAALGFGGLTVLHALVDGELMLRDGYSTRLDEAALLAEVHEGVATFLGKLAPL